MPIFMVERRFADDLDASAEQADQINRINEEEGVRWLYSFLSADKRKTYCLYEAPFADAIRRAAEPGSEIQPRVTASVAAWVRLAAPVLSRMLRTWLAAVFSAILRREAISLLLLPAASSRSTAISRGVSPAASGPSWPSRPFAPPPGAASS